MSVAKALRGKGVGTQLLGHLFEWATTQGLLRLELSVFSNNTAAISLYERLGFVGEGAQRNAVEVEGGYVDMVMMVKMLKPAAGGGGAVVGTDG
jgi:RimJ/RimL family protein N-acetyltransferase